MLAREIPEKCFRQSSIQEIVLPKTIKTIEAYGFKHSKLRKINGEHLSKIENYAFFGTSLKKLELNSIEKIEEGAFAYCKYLEELDLSKSIINELKYSFAYSPKIKFKIPKTLKIVNKKVLEDFNDFPIF